jgi:hypothetical protein
MISSTVFLSLAGGLIILLGAGCGVGGVTLWNGKPDNWPDVVASDGVVRRTARGLVGMGVLLLATGLTTIFGIPVGCVAGGISTLLFVVGGFLGNHALFGDIRPKHTGPNVVLACVIWILIWFGFPVDG